MKNSIVLLVEDEPAMSVVLQAALQREGVDAQVAKDGTEALVMAKERHPGLILLDILMPRMDGFSMLKALRKEPWGADVKVVILTNYSDIEKRRQALEMGVADYWIKTEVSLETIVERVKAKLATD